MVLSRLLLPETRFHLLKTGLPKKTRCCSSSSSPTSADGEAMEPPQSKKSGAAKEQRAIAVESYVKDYMATHQGVFPKPSHVQSKVGGSWYTLKDILTSLKDKMLGNPQLQNHVSGGTSDSTVDIRASEITHDRPHNVEPETVSPLSESVSGFERDENTTSVMTSDKVGENSKDVISNSASLIIKMCNSINNNEIVEPKSIVHASETMTDSLGEEKHISSGSASDIMGKNNRTVSEVSDSHMCNSNIVEFGEKECIEQFSKTITDSQNHEKSTSRSMHPCPTEYNSSKNLVLPREISNSSGQVESDKGHRQPTDDVSESGKLVHVTSKFLNEAIKGLDSDDLNIYIPMRNLNCQTDKKIAIYGQIPHACSEVDEMHSSSGRAQKETGLADKFPRSLNNRAGVETDKNDVLTPTESLEFSKETLGENLATGPDLSGLINCIKELPREQSIVKSQKNIISSKTDQVRTGGSVGKNQSEAILHISDSKEGGTSINGHTMGNYGKVRTGGSVEKIQSKTNLHISDSKEDRTSVKGHAMGNYNQVINKGSIRTVLSQTEVPKWKKVEQRTVKSPALGKESEKFNGSKQKPRTTVPFVEALEKTNLIEFYHDATASVEDMHSSYIPDLVGDPDVPVTLVKYPTRTVKIETLTNRISSRQLKEALALFGSGVTSLFMGSSSTATYVEFETEDAKERAIAKHSITVLGEKLLIFRIDVPRTTVVRISSTNMSNLPKFNSICNSYGRVSSVRQRGTGTLDVCFEIVEWPNMVHILNKLNGLEIEGSRCLAQPAPVFPPEILKVLWSRPDGRRQVKAMMRSILQKLEENSPIMAELSDVVANYYGEELNESINHMLKPSISR